MPQPTMEEGLISVVMSTYNRLPAYLTESIESILCQTYSRFELIIIDDGSDNGARERIESYHDPRIRLIVNEANIGLTRSLNRGLEACRGEYIARMDDDDIAYPDRFEKQMAFMRENPDVIVCGTWVEYIDGDGNPTGFVPRDTIEDMETYRIRLLFGNHPTIYHPSAFLNRRLLLRHQIQYCPAYRYAQDYGLWVRCSRVGRCVILPEVLMKYRTHAKAISIAKLDEQKRAELSVIQTQLDALRLVMPDELKPLHDRLLSDYSDAHKKHTKEFKNWLKTIIKANRQYKAYNQKKLKKTIWNSWRIICQLAVKEKPGFRKSVSIILSLTPRGFLYSLKSAVEKIIRR